MISVKYTDYRNSAGFTIIEVMMAVVLVSVSLLAMASLSGTLIARNSQADQITTATTLAQDKIEELKNNTSFASIGNSTVPQTPYTITTTVSDQTTWKNIDVTVTWARGGKTHQVALQTIIANLE